MGVTIAGLTEAEATVLRYAADPTTSVASGNLMDLVRPLADRGLVTITPVGEWMRVDTTPAGMKALADYERAR